MNDTAQITLGKDVGEYVAAIRAALADLSTEERDELTGGLEADLSELAAEDGGARPLGEVLGSPEEYAAELRLAAGLPTEAGSRKRRLRHPGVSTSERVGVWLDRGRDAWLGRAESERFAPAWQLLLVVRPAWWVTRAWVAVQLVDANTGPWESPTLIPSLGHGLAGPVLLLAAVVLSTMIGTRQLWPGPAVRSSTLARVVLLSLNVTAIVGGIAVTAGWPQSDVVYNYRDSFRPVGNSLPEDLIRNDGARVCNIHAYDAAGKPLIGVQLYDQDGRPLEVHCAPGPGRPDLVSYPWLSGEEKRWHVFPQPERRQRDTHLVRADAYDRADPPAFPQPDRTGVPPVTNPLVDR